MQPYFYILVAISLCYIYVIMAQFFSHKKFNYIHETAIAIIFGVIFGVFIYFFTDAYSSDDFGKIFRGVIFLILLPPMLFEDGYNIRKRKFFQNILYINLYGVVGTIMNFFIIFGIVYAFSVNGLISSVGDGKVIYLQNWQMLALSACLCSIDTVVPEKIINPQRFPKLFSIIFGQSIMKDTITVTLFDAIIRVYNRLNNLDDDINADASAIGQLILGFFIVVVASIFIGLISGLVTTIIFKNFRFLLTEKGVSEVALIVLTGYAGYIISEWCQFSGVISMLFCGITLSHFNIYNLTVEGKSATKITVSVLALLAEGIMFFTIGAFVFNIEQTDDGYYFSWILLLIVIGTILIGRFVNIYLTSLFGYLIMGKDKWKINYYEYQIIYFAGLVKGAVPFALILSCPIINSSASKSKEINTATNCIQITVVYTVFFGSLFWNSILPKVLRNRRNKIIQMIKQNPDQVKMQESLLVHPISRSGSIVSQNIEGQYALVENAAFSHKMKNTTQKYWRKCEEGCLKPYLIYDYRNRKDQIKEEKKKQRQEEVEEYWEMFYLHHDIEDDKTIEENKQLDMKLIQLSQKESEDEEEEVKEEESEKSAFKTVRQLSEQQIQPIIHQQTKQQGKKNQ